MINRTVLVGRLTKDPELKFTSSNIAVVTFTLAVNRNFKGADGVDVDFINCVAWRKVAESTGKYTRKGSLVGVDGRIQTRNYEAQDGTKRYITEVVADNVRFLDSKPKDGASAPGATGSDSVGTEKNKFNPFDSVKEEKNEDPFDPKSGIEIGGSDLPF